MIVADMGKPGTVAAWTEKGADVEVGHRNFWIGEPLGLDRDHVQPWKPRTVAAWTENAADVSAQPRKVWIGELESPTSRRDGERGPSLITAEEGTKHSCWASRT